MLFHAHFDAGNCFSVLGSSMKIVPRIGVSVSPLENIDQHRVFQAPNGKGLSKKQFGDRTNVVLVHEPRRHGFFENPRREHRGVVKKKLIGEELNVHAKCSTKCVDYIERSDVGIVREGEKTMDCSVVLRRLNDDFKSKKANTECLVTRVSYGERANGSAVREAKKGSFVENPCCGIGKKIDFGEEFLRVNNKPKVKKKKKKKKVHAKCSTKWMNYGGCIPAILQALDEFRDLDEALKPWEESLSNKEMSIILKEQSNWERALEIFEWLKRKVCYELNVIHYNIVLRILGRAMKWCYVERLWDVMREEGIEPINSTYGTLIDVYSKSGLTREALCWLAKMNKQGMEPDEVTMGIIVQLYKKTGEFRKAEVFFKKWSSGQRLRNEAETKSTAVSLSIRTYNTLIDTFGKAGKFREASEVFDRMLSDGIAPTTVTFNTMIHICGNHGHWEEVTSLMEKMEELRCSPDTRTYNILISFHAKHDGIVMATNYFTKMKEASLEPDLVSYRTLLHAYSVRHMISEAEGLVSEMDSRGLQIDEFTQSALTRMYVEAGELEKSWLWFRRFHLEGSMSSDCYSANIDAYGERGYVSEAERVFHCCREVKRLSVLEFNVMIKAYGIGKSYYKACALFDSIESHGVVPDKCTYSSLIQILASANLPHQAKCYLEKMRDSGIVSDCVPYCAVISSFTKVGKLEIARTVYEEMIGSNIGPDVMVFGILINAFADVGCVQEALGYVDEMESSGLACSVVIYNSLIKLYTKAGLLKEAQETYKLLLALDEGPGIYSSNCMIDLYSERSMVKPAEEIFEGLERKGVANEFTYAMMLCLYKKIGRFEDGIVIAKRMRELGLLTDLLSYNNVLGLYTACGRFEEVAATFKGMLEAAVQPDDCTFKTLAGVLFKSGISKRSVAELEVSTKRDPPSGIPKWVSALSSVVRLNDYD